MSVFQIVILAVFAVFLIIGVLLFAGVGGFGSQDNPIGEVVIWGTYDENLMNRFINELSIDDSRLDGVTYIEKDPRFFNEELVEALASGSGPDLFFLFQEDIVRHEDKIQPISYEIMSEREFKDTFVEEGELFLESRGILGMPFILDPMVLYWNRAHYATAGISRPPRFWDEFLSIAIDGVLTKKGENGAIVQSSLSFGEYRNIIHAKELLSMLMLQAGNSIAKRQEGQVVSQLRFRLSDNQFPAENALRFYTDFANPLKSVYSWNRALPEAQKAFARGILSSYIGFSSEIRSIRAQNANLNFDVAAVPQVRTSNLSVTFGNMIALATPKTSQNQIGAMSTAFILTSENALQKLSDVTGLPPVLRALLTARPSDPFKAIFTDAALQSRAWLDPNSKETETIFQNMIESVVSGRLRISEVIRISDSEIESLLRN